MERNKRHKVRTHKWNSHTGKLEFSEHWFDHFDKAALYARSLEADCMYKIYNEHDELIEAGNILIELELYC